MEIDSFTELARKRISLAKEYLDKLKEKMGDCFLYAYLYGSTAKNTCHKESDIDLILVVKKPTQEERALMNSGQSGLFEGDRCGRINFAYNSHYFFVLCRQFQEKHHMKKKG
ncbi:MAG: nucleotidyltransferase domain-containing protein [Patescibacteria group bacterium]